MPGLIGASKQTRFAPSRALREFLATEAASGVLLVLATAIALIWANSPWRGGYEALWETRLSISLGHDELTLDLRHWVNEGLMALFFLVVALEVKREFLLGELRDRRQAALPVFGAVGGMVLPALAFFAFNPSGPEARGWGIPMATDIAFALGVLALVARSAPPAVRLFLLTLAIVDDIGAIVVIALFYSDSIAVPWLALAMGLVVLIVVLRRLGFSAPMLFVALGIGLWFTLHQSGVHATLAGVAMGLLAPATPALTREIIGSRADEVLNVFTPAAARETKRIARQAVAELEWLEHLLHGWTSLVIVPLFALANAGIRLTGDTVSDATESSVTAGVVIGLVVGKTIGIGGGAWLAIRLRLADRPEDVTWRQLSGAAALGGIGFTVSLFITGLAFDQPDLEGAAKVGILLGSMLATVAGAALLSSRARRRDPILEPSQQ